MIIQDEIFDLEEFLESTDTVQSNRFDRIVRYICRLEKDLEHYQKFYSSFENLKLAIKAIEGKAQ